MNSFNYNVTGEKRKKLVRTMSEILGEDASYQGAPSFAFKVDGYTVSRDGLVTCPDTAAREEVDHLVDTLKEKGFTPESALENNAPASVFEDGASENVSDNTVAEDDSSFLGEMPRAGSKESKALKGSTPVQRTYRFPVIPR